MAEKKPTQRTPKDYEIPVPTREQVLGDLAKTAQPQREAPKRKRRRKS